MHVILAPEDGDPLARWNAAVDSIMRKRGMTRSAAIDVAMRDSESRKLLELSKARTFDPVLTKSRQGDDGGDLPDQYQTESEANEQLDEMVSEMRRKHPSMTKSAAWTAVVSAEPGRTLLRKSLVRSREANRPR